MKERDLHRRVYEGMCTGQGMCIGQRMCTQRYMKSKRTCVNGGERVKEFVDFSSSWLCGPEF